MWASGLLPLPADVLATGSRPEPVRKPAQGIWKPWPSYAVSPRCWESPRLHSRNAWGDLLWHT